MILFEACLAQNVENVFHSTLSDRLNTSCVIKEYTLEFINFMDFFCHVKKVVTFTGHTMKAFKRNKVIAVTIIFNISASWRRVVTFMPLPLYAQARTLVPIE